MHRNETVLNAALKYFLLFLPIIFYFIFLNHYALNLPYHDDYLAILDFLNNFSSAGLAERCGLLLQQYNEHRLLSGRITYAVYYLVTGHINFKDLIFIGNLQLVGIFLILLAFVKKLAGDHWFWPGMILSLSLFDISGYENTFWAMACNSNYGVAFLFLLSLYLYDSAHSRYWIAAFVVQAIATFSNGNGILASLCLAAFTLFSGNRIKMSLGLACFLVFTPLYFFHYTHSAGQKHPNTPGHIITGIYGFMGAHFTFNRIRYGYYMFRLASLGVLGSLLFAFPYSKKLTDYKPYLPLLATLGFLISTFGVTSLYRYCIQYIPSRYLVYSHICFAIAVLFLLVRLQFSRWRVPVTATCAAIAVVGMCLNYYNCLGKVRENRKDIINHEYYIGGGIWEPTEEVKGKAISDRACKLGIYCQGNERINYKLTAPDRIHQN